MHRQGLYNKIKQILNEKGEAMDIFGMLEEIRAKALRDPQLKEKLMATRSMEEPVSEFCKVCREIGYEIYDMDLICAGEDFYATMKRSTNGGGENSPYLQWQDDFYELFLAGL